MLLLALVTGVPALSFAVLRRIECSDSDTSFLQIIDAIRPDFSNAPQDECERLDGFLSGDKDSKWTSLPVAELAKSVQRVGQFSFERRQMLRMPRQH
jgi:hypothetical protein